MVRENRYWLAMAMFAFLAALAWFTLDGNVRNVTLAVLAMFAVRTMVYDRHRTTEEKSAEDIDEERSRD